MKPNRVPIVAAIALVCVVAIILLLQSLLPPKPVFIAMAHAPVTDATWADGAWYWLEGAGTPGARLIRDAGPTITVVAAESEISSFAAGQGRVIWAAGNARHWHMSASAPDGSGRVAIWSGAEKPRGLYVADRHMIWLADALLTATNKAGKHYESSSFSKKDVR